MIKNNKIKSFTLIELLISILLFGILSSSSYTAYFYLSNVVEKRNNLIYLNESFFNFYFFVNKDIVSAGYTDINTLNGKINPSINITNNGKNMTITYDENANTRNVHSFTFDEVNHLVLLNNNPLAVNVKSVLYTFDTINPKRIIVDIIFKSPHKFNGNFLTRNYRFTALRRN